MMSHPTVHRIAQTLEAYKHCSEPRPGQRVADCAMSELLSELGTRVFEYARQLDPAEGIASGKAQVLAGVLSGIACCLAGVAEGVPQHACQEYSTEMMEQLRTTVAAHCRNDPPMDYNPDIDPTTN